MRFSCFSVLPGSAEAQVIRSGIVICLLIAYSVSNISAKKISKSIPMSQSYSNPKHGVYKDVRFLHASRQPTGRRPQLRTSGFVLVEDNNNTA